MRFEIVYQTRDSPGIVTDESLESIRIPVQILVGSKDDQGILEKNALIYGSTIPNCTVEILPDVTHYTFLSEGTWWAKIFDRKFLHDPKGVKRRKVHDIAASSAVNFFSKTLKNENQSAGSLPAECR